TVSTPSPPLRGRGEEERSPLPASEVRGEEEEIRFRMSENAPVPDQASPSRWPHRWAVLTVCATVGLLLIGARVTTLGVGMAAPEWRTHPLHLFFSSRNDSGYLIEHSHRLAGYVVGCCVIVLAVLLWLREPRRWVRWLGIAALVGVTLQGILGGFRVRLH